MNAASINSSSLYDLSPLVSLMLVGLLLALGPVLWVWLKGRNTTSLQRLQALRLITLFLTFDLLLFGAFTRLSDSGLGCPDWPGCYGNTSPAGASKHISVAQADMPTGPVTFAKAWIEMLHRYLATALGALIMLLTGLAWRDWLRQRSLSAALKQPNPMPWLPTLTLVWVCVQGAFGAWTVTMKLFPAIVTLHLLGAMVLLVLLCVQVVQGASRADQAPAMGSRMRQVLGWSIVLLFVQLALGGWVSANYAVLACSDFPTCQGRLWPEMNFQQGFELWRALGFTAAGEHISFSALTAIHYVHRLVAYVSLTLMMVLAWQLNRSKPWRLHSRVLAGLIGLQLATGLGNVVLGWPLLAALLHTGGAGGMVLTLTWLAASARAPADLPASASGSPSMPGMSA